MKNAIFTLFLILFFISCTTQSEKTVGFLVPDLKYEFYQKNEKYFKEHAKELGLDVAFFDAGGNEDIQYKQAMELIDGGVKVIVICSVNTNLSAAIVREAHKKNVKIIAYDRLIRNCDLDYYVTHSSVAVGELMTKYAISIKPKGNYVLFFGDRSDQNTLFVREGILNVLLPLINSGNVKVVYQSYIEGWRGDEAYYEMERFLRLSKDSVDVVIASSDDISIGVVNLLKTKGLEGKFVITGQNADIAVIKSIINGEQSMTIYKPVKDLAYITVELADQLLKNQNPTNVKSIVNNGRIDVPSILLPVETVVKGNIEDVLIKSGYYSKEQIFGN
jgi:D-xylose ABC transporter substrate-binding protein